MEEYYATLAMVGVGNLNTGAEWRTTQEHNIQLESSSSIGGEIGEMAKC
jgi:hypothetical protein